MGIKRKQLNFESLLSPYKEGGSKEQPVQRTLGTIASKLIIVYGLPVQVVGAAVFKVFYAMAYEGLEFTGDGKYGSKGKELFSCIKAQAVDMVKNETTEAMVQEIKNMTACVDKKCKKRMEVAAPKTHFWQRNRTEKVLDGPT